MKDYIQQNYDEKLSSYKLRVTGLTKWVRLTRLTVSKASKARCWGREKGIAYQAYCEQSERTNFFCLYNSAASPVGRNLIFNLYNEPYITNFIVVN